MTANKKHLLFNQLKKEDMMKNSFLLIALIFSIGFAKAPEYVTIEGRINGANCMFFLKSCSDDMPKGHIDSEPDFVVAVPDGKYYFIPNVDRFTKKKYFHQNVRIIGKLKKDGSIIAKTIEVERDGKYRKVWSLKKVREERARESHI